MARVGSFNSRQGLGFSVRANDAAFKGQLVVEDHEAGARKSRFGVGKLSGNEKDTFNVDEAVESRS